MRFVSYAQNFEDVMLWRALKHVQNGFYVDVGAAYPLEGSVTKAFYERGWSGINIEPNKQCHAALQSDRLRDINLNIAISTHSQKLDFFESKESGWSSTNPAIGGKLLAEHMIKEIYSVEARSLNEIIEEYKIQDIHFLKIDVEGAEKDVLLGLDLERFRPWILVLEATKPNSQEDVSNNWEFLVASREYEFVYFDGLNKFYLARERSHLKIFFNSPPCVFDNFVLAQQQKLVEQVGSLEQAKVVIENEYAEVEGKYAEVEKKHAEVEKKYAKARKQYMDAKGNLDELTQKSKCIQTQLDVERARYSAVLASNSWKLTKPLRVFGRIVRRPIMSLHAGLTFGRNAAYRMVKRVRSRIVAIRENRIKFYGHISGAKPVLILDMYVLGQAVKTGVYRVCDELYLRFAQQKDFDIVYFAKGKSIQGVQEYLSERKLPNYLQRVPQSKISGIKEKIFFSPFGLVPNAVLSWPATKLAYFIHDLIAIKHPEYFHVNAAREVQDIICSLTKESIIFVNSESTKNDLLTYRSDIEIGQVTVTHLAADNRFHAPESFKLWPEKPPMPYVLALATLEIRKNMETVIDAFDDYVGRCPNTDLVLVIAGMTGWKLEKLKEKWSKKSYLRNKVIFTGFVEDEYLPALYRGAECFVYMSRYEGFGLPPLEAMACGVPVITSNNSSLPEVVGDAGVMLDCDDFFGVSEAIEKIHDDVEYRSQLSKKALSRAKIFDWNQTASIMIKRLKKEIGVDDAGNGLA